MHRIRHNDRLALALLFGLAGCGGSNSPTSPTSPTTTTPPAPVATVLQQGSFSDLCINCLDVLDPFTTTTAGALAVTVDWTFVEDNIEIYLAQGQCTVDQVNQGTCVFAGRAETTAKPERINIASLPPGTYSLMVGNRGPRVESFSYQIVLTR